MIDGKWFAFMIDIKIRQGAPSDGYVIAQMAIKLSLHEGEKPPLFGETEYQRFGFGKEKKFNTFVAESDKIICGYVLYCESFHVGLGSPGFNMLDLFVEKNWRRRGVGKLLMSAIASECSILGDAWITWQCHPKNKIALNFYQSIAGRRFNGADFELAGDALIKLSS